MKTIEYYKSKLTEEQIEMIGCDDLFYEADDMNLPLDIYTELKGLIINSTEDYNEAFKYAMKNNISSEKFAEVHQYVILNK